jgi:hypothetical protein
MSPHPETEAAAPGTGGVPVAIGGAEAPWIVEPGAAANRMPVAVAVSGPC